MPTVAESISMVEIAKACGYKTVISVDNMDNLNSALEKTHVAEKPLFIEVKSAIGSRPDLGRPTTTPVENKEALMKYLLEEK